MPKKVRKRWEHGTKTKFWYVNVGSSTSFDIGAAVTFVNLKLRNMYNQVAEGRITAGGGGVGLKVTGSPVSWSDETSFMTDEDVGFEDFNGVHVRYTTIGVALGVGYSAAWLTFYGMGSGAASIYVGGWNAGLDASAALNSGIMVIDKVPPNYQMEYYDTTEWTPVDSDWMSSQSQTLLFADASAVPPAGQIETFAGQIAANFKTP